MTANDVLEVIDALGGPGVDVWIDGGWGIDALVGEQTRPHDDLDVVIRIEDVESARSALSALGFVVSEDELPTRFVCRDLADRRIDFHPMTFRPDGNVHQELQDGSLFTVPASGLDGQGAIGDRAVRCLTPAVQLAAHLGYTPDATDHHDMLLLQAHFALDLPEPYRS